MTQVRKFINFFLPTDQMIPWAVITTGMALILAIAKQFTIAGIVLSGAVSAAAVLVSFRVVTYLIEIAADIADDIGAIRNKLENIGRTFPDAGPPDE